MLKKTGIIVAAAAAGVLGLSSLAFATTGNDDHGHGHSHSSVEYSNTESGNLGNDCDFAQDGGSVDQNLAGGGSLLGVGGAVDGLVAPVTTQIQALNCTNIGISDVIDVDSGNTTETTTETEIDESFNSVED
ncbi:MAG TPA: hypothetical protein VEZ42_03755 [Pseudonocardia sp.]|nr:hypothetical protein [Pseudonocardia sp.]